jgi:hypothetical protein
MAKFSRYQGTTRLLLLLMLMPVCSSWVLLLVCLAMIGALSSRFIPLLLLLLPIISLWFLLHTLHTSSLLLLLLCLQPG